MTINFHNDSIKTMLKLTPFIRHILEKIAMLLIPLPLFMLFSGINGIIENESPEHLANFSSMGSSFLNFFGLHTLIFSGAFGITLIVWFVTKSVWSNSIEKTNDKNIKQEEVN